MSSGDLLTFFFFYFFSNRLSPPVEGPIVSHCHSLVLLLCLFQKLSDDEKEKENTHSALNLDQQNACVGPLFSLSLKRTMIIDDDDLPGATSTKKEKRRKRKKLDFA